MYEANTALWSAAAKVSWQRGHKRSSVYHATLRRVTGEEAPAPDRGPSPLAPQEWAANGVRKPPA